MVYDSVYEANKYFRLPAIPATATTYNWDFSTTPTGWTELDSSKMGITGGKFHAKSISDNSNDTVYVNVGDLGDNWIIRMKAESVGYNAISSGGLLYIGLVESGDKADTWIDTNNLGIMLGERYGDGTNLGGRVVEGGSIISGGTTWGSSSSYIDMADNGSTVYLELKLVGGYSSGTFSATTYTDETYSTVYSGGNNGANTNNITVGNASPSNTSSGLTYLVFKNPTDSATGSTSNYLEFNFDDLQIYSGVTSVEPAHPDVRKQHFWEYFSGSKLQEASVTDEVTGGTTDAGFNSNIKGFGSKVQTGDTLVGKKITKLSIELKNNGSGVGGNITLGVFNTTSSTPVFTFGTFSASTLTSSYQYFEQENLTGHTLVADQVLGFIASGDISNLKVRRYNGGTGGRPTLYGMYHAVSSGSNWQNAGDAQDINMKVGYAGGTRWTTTTGGASIEMNDEADGGLKLYTTSTGTNSNFTMNFDNKRQYAHDGSVCIFTLNADVQQASTTNWFLQVGLGHTVGNTGHWLSAKSAQSYLRLQTSQSESATYSADTTVSNSPAWVTAKIENKSSSCDLSLNGTVAVTNSSGLQTSTGMQPVVYGNRGTSGSAGSNPLVCKLRYFEAYNT